jgi:transposase
MLKTGCHWELLPGEYSPKSTVHRRYLLWKKKKVFYRFFRKTLARQWCILIPPFDWQKWCAKISKAGKYKFSKITALCNEQGQIQAFELGTGGQSDHKAIEPMTLPLRPVEYDPTLEPVDS